MSSALSSTQWPPRGTNATNALQNSDSYRHKNFAYAVIATGLFTANLCSQRLIYSYYHNDCSMLSGDALSECEFHSLFLFSLNVSSVAVVGLGLTIMGFFNK